MTIHGFRGWKKSDDGDCQGLCVQSTTLSTTILDSSLLNCLHTEPVSWPQRKFQSTVRATDALSDLTTPLTDGLGWPSKNTFDESMCKIAKGHKLPPWCWWRSFKWVSPSPLQNCSAQTGTWLSVSWNQEWTLSAKKEEQLFYQCTNFFESKLRVHWLVEGVAVCGTFPLRQLCTGSAIFFFVG